MGLSIEQEREFTAFVDARGSDLLRTAVLLAGSRHAGEDLLQAVLVKAVRRWPSITGDPAAYLRKALATTAVDQSLRRRWREVSRVDLPDVATRDSGVVEDRDQVLRALRTLLRASARCSSCATTPTCPRPRPRPSSGSRSAPSRAPPHAPSPRCGSPFRTARSWA